MDSSISSITFSCFEDEHDFSNEMAEQKAFHSAAAHAFMRASVQDHDYAPELFDFYWILTRSFQDYCFYDSTNDQCFPVINGLVRVHTDFVLKHLSAICCCRTIILFYILGNNLFTILSLIGSPADV